MDIASPARPTKPPRRKDREELMNFVGIVSPARPTKPPRRKDREELMNFVGIVSPARPLSHQGGKTERS